MRGKAAKPLRSRIYLPSSIILESVVLNHKDSGKLKLPRLLIVENLLLEKVTIITLVGVLRRLKFWLPVELQISKV